MTSKSLVFFGCGKVKKWINTWEPTTLNCSGCIFIAIIMEVQFPKCSWKRQLLTRRKRNTNGFGLAYGKRISELKNFIPNGVSSDSGNIYFKWETIRRLIGS